ncbi:complement receptor type 1-like isoform X2 [Mauremys mutica]|uniref:complement receptor type 1-like isoform X2 n=1 Tax=Mauremys mutica TaxID=74926 RepID=UPI001D16E220|nr:complement receptor type 1-like isoform X2 [Mauremys mutica]
MVSAPRCRPGARGLLALLLLLPLPGARGLCGAPPRLSRARRQNTSCTEDCPIGTEVTYRCSGGFVKIPGKSDTVVCLSNSEWSNFGEFCNGGCGAPPRLKSATLSKEDGQKNYYPKGTTASYVCRPGYESTEVKPVITCLENLRWSEAPEFCIGKSCGVPKGPEHGRAVVLTNDLYGARANIICDEGFRLHGRPFIQCLLKGDQVEWSQLPTCQDPCGPPGRRRRDTNSCGGGSVKSLGICDSPPRLSFAELPGTVNDSYPVGTELKYSCRPGYVLGSGKSPLVVCLANSTWSVDPEFCVGRLCKQLELENGRVDLTDLRFGATANFSCDEGYRLIGMTSAQCVVAGNGVNWDKRLPHCQAIPCLPPPDITSGSHTGQSEQEFSFGSAVTYKCDQGFSLIGEASIHCTTKDNVNGEWSGPAPECEGRLCKQLELENGRVDLTDLRFGATANFSCDEGYRLIGMTSAQCVVAGNGVNWDKRLPHCQAIPCLPPPDITSGSHTGQSEQEFSFGSAVTYKCDQGFSLIGEASIHCTTKDNVNGEWSGPAPECEDQCVLPRRRRRDTNGKEVPYKCGDGPGKNPEPGFDTRIGIPGIGSNIAIAITVAAITIAIAIVTGIVAGLNKKWKKKKGSYGVNLDSPKYHIAPEDDLQMSETKSNLIIKV